MKKSKIAIIGGGCSGLFLANLLKDSNADTYIFEKNNKLGKKILASGNGKCNFTNVYSMENKYNDLFANNIINRFDVSKTLSEFSKMGLIYKNDDQGRCYPVSECSSSVLDCLKRGLKNIHILLDSEVKKIEIADGGKYLVKYNDKSDIFDFVVCCSGSVASNLGSIKAYNYLDNLGVKKEELKPSLAPVIVKEDISLLKGVRIKCEIKLVDENSNIVYKELGEVLFKEDSLSGIAVFNASSYINRRKQKYKISLDLSAGMNYSQLFDYMNRRKKEYPNLFKGYLNDKVAEYVLSKFSKNQTIDESIIHRLVNEIMNLEFEVKGIYPLKDSQVCSGGICLEEVNSSLELIRYSNIYVAGEVLDIDGVSGGYNMQFAWSSAGVIASGIKSKIGDKYEKKE